MRLPLSQATHPKPCSRREARFRYLKRCDLGDSFSRPPPTLASPTFQPMPPRANFPLEPGWLHTEDGLDPRCGHPGRLRLVEDPGFCQKKLRRGSTCSAHLLRNQSTLSPIPAARSVKSRSSRRAGLTSASFRRNPHAFQRGSRSGRSASPAQHSEKHCRRTPPGVTRARRRCFSPISATDHVVKRAPLGPTDPRATSSHSPVRRGLRAPRDPHFFVRAVKHDISHP